MARIERKTLTKRQDLCLVRTNKIDDKRLIFDDLKHLDNKQNTDRRNYN